MEISLDVARNLLVELGYSKAGAWNLVKVSRYINRFDELDNADEEIDDEDLESFRGDIMQAVLEDEEVDVTEGAPKRKPGRPKKVVAVAVESYDEDDEVEPIKPKSKAKKSGKVVVEDDEDEEDEVIEVKKKPGRPKKVVEEEVPKKKLGRPKKVVKEDEDEEEAPTVKRGPGRPRKDGSVEPVAKKEKIPLDKFGSRVGTNLNKINEVFSATPKTIDEIAEEAGLDNTFFRKHLKRLMDDGHIVKTDKGYRITPKAKIKTK